jgi:hypothetical protein
MGDRPQDVVVSKRCTKCGVVQPLASFGVDREQLDGRSSECRVCRRLRERAARASRSVQNRAGTVPRVLGRLTGQSLLESVVGAYRQHYDGRLALMVPDLQKQLAAIEPVERVNAHVALMACREIGEALRSMPVDGTDLDETLDSLPDADWQRLAERQAKRRAPPV